MPRSLATCGSVDPEASLPSACRSLRTICSGERLLPNFESPPFAHSGLLDSHRNWIRFRGRVTAPGPFDTTGNYPRRTS
jgi:hypothetical protein